MDNEPTVSVVIPAYKAASTAGKAVQSCLDDPQAREVIVVVDGPDAALEAAIPNADRVRTIVNSSTLGAPAARNVGLAAARGEFTLFLDADDYVEGGLISSLARAGAENRADLVFGSFAFEFPSGDRIPVNVASTMTGTDAITVLRKWFAGYYVPCCSVMWRTAFVRKIGGWDESLMKNQDGELVLRACREEPVIALATEGRGVYVQGQSGDRITKNVSEPMFRQQIEFLAGLENDMAPGKFRLLAAEIGAIYYRLARVAYFNNHLAIGDVAEKSARRLGFAGHEGSLAHRGLARLLGLKRKEQMSAALHRGRRRP